MTSLVSYDINKSFDCLEKAVTMHCLHSKRDNESLNLKIIKTETKEPARFSESIERSERKISIRNIDIVLPNYFVSYLNFSSFESKFNSLLKP